MTKMTTDLGDVNAVQERLKKRGRGPGALTFLEKTPEKQHENCQTLFVEWSTQKAHNIAELSLDHLTAATSRLELLKHTSQIEYTAFKRNTLDDFIKLK